MIVPSAALAHNRVIGSYAVRVEGASAEWHLRIDAVDLGGLMQADTDRDGLFSEPELRARSEAIAAYLAERLTLSTDGVACEAEVIGFETDGQSPPHWLDFTGTFECPQPMGVVEVGNRVLYDFIPEYVHLVDFQTPAGYVQRILNRERPSIRVRVAETAAGVGSEGSDAVEADESEPDIELPSGPLDRIALFVKEGVHHILIGYDHILFILGLTLAAGSLRRLVGIVTAFTIAHSITLALASLELLTIDIGLAEALIALSVAWVGLENVWHEPRHRWALAFAFGLIHGVGFSSVLGDLVTVTAMDRAARAELLFGFNVGVELGQVAIVCAVWPIIALLRRRGWQRRVVVVASTGIFVVGVWWFVERLS